MFISKRMVPFSVGSHAAYYRSEVDSIHEWTQITNGHLAGQENEGALPVHELSPAIESYFQEEPSPEPKPLEDFATDKQNNQEGFYLRGDVGNEEFVDRYEEIIDLVAPATLPREEVPPLDDSFKISIGDITPPMDDLEGLQKSVEEEERGDYYTEETEEGTTIW